MLSDSELIEELKNRLEQTRQALENLSATNRTLKAVNERLRASEALKSNFLSNIRNEINNPLNVIMGIAAQIRWGLEDDHPLAKLAEIISHESQDLNFQLCNIMAAADLESGSCTAEAGQVDIIAMFNGILDTFSPHITEKNLHITFENDNESLEFITDPPKLSLIFSNLLDNAIKFSNERGAIHIRAECIQHVLTVSVSDSGIGIAPEDLGRIFDRFLQIDTGSTRAHRGHGLGLSIVKAMLDMLNGTIRTVSTPGKGATFSITLPALDLPEEIDLFADDGNLMIFDQTRNMQDE